MHGHCNFNCGVNLDLELGFFLIHPVYFLMLYGILSAPRSYDQNYIYAILNCCKCKALQGWFVTSILSTFKVLKVDWTLPLALI